MKKVSFTFAVLVAATSLFLMSCAGGGLEIDGVRWATSNVGASSAHQAGTLFTWEEAQTACPRGWRLPTATEMEALRAVPYSDWTTLRGTNGIYLGTGSRRIFIPAAGWLSAEGEIVQEGMRGYLWSSTAGEPYLAQHLWFDRTSRTVASGNTASRFSVRCVR